MAIWVLIVLLLVPVCGCQSIDSLPNSFINHTLAPVEQTNYTEIITRWAQVRHPQEEVNFKVLTIKAVQTDNGPNGIMAFQVYFFHKVSPESYILFIRNGVVIGWIYAGVPEIEEEEEKEQIFSHKDQA